jgi:tetratricopeptide (TPR) repeat protein
MDLERYNDAVKTLRQAVRLESDNEDVWLDLSEATYYESGINEALKILDEAEEMFDEENAMIVYRKAAFLFEEGKNQKAVSQLLRGLSIDAEMYTSIYSFNQDLEKNEIIQEIVTMFLNQ